MNVDPNETSNTDFTEGSTSNEPIMPNEVPIANEVPMPNEAPLSNEVPMPNEAPLSNEVPMPNEAPLSNEMPMSNETSMPDDIANPSGDFYSTGEFNQNFQSNNNQVPDFDPNMNYNEGYMNQPQEYVNNPQEYVNNQQEYVNNQQYNNYQPMNDGDGGAVPSGTNNKKRNKIVIAVVAALSIALIAVICLFVFGKNSKAKMFKAMEKTYDSYSGVFGKDIDFDTIKDNSKNKNLYSGYKLTFNGVSGDVDSYVIELLNGILGGTEFSIEDTTNVKDKKENGSFSLKVLEYDFEAKYFATKDSIGISIPKLFNETLTFDTKNFTKKYNESAIREYFKMDKIEDDFSINIFEDGLNKDVDTQKIEKDSRALYNNMIVKNKGKVKKEINGQTLSCTEYKATILKEDIKALINDVAETGDVKDVDALNEVLKKDVVFKVYVHNDKMVALESSYEMQVDGETGIISVDFDFSKSQIVGTVEMKADDSTVSMLFENNITDTSCDYTLTVKEDEESMLTASLSSEIEDDNISINGDIRIPDEEDAIMALNCNGSLSNVKKGRSYSINLDNIEFIIGNSLTISMSAEANVNTDGTIEIPESSECTKVFDMTTQDIEKLITEIQTNGMADQDLLNMIQSIMSMYSSSSSSDDYYDDTYDDYDYYEDDYDSYDNDTTNDNSSNNIIKLKDIEENEINILCKDKTVEIYDTDEEIDAYSTAIMNDGQYYAGFMVFQGDNIDDVFKQECDFYVEYYDAKVSDLQTCNGFSYKTISYEEDDIKNSCGIALLQMGDFYLEISISLDSFNYEGSIEEAVQFVLNNIEIIE